MKTKYILLLSLIIILGSCSTAYRSGQTPDDVYYSPTPQQNSYANNDQDGEDSYYSEDSEDGSYYSADQENREIRRGIYDRRYRNSLSLNLGLGFGGYSSFGYNSFGYNSFGYNPFGYYSYNPFGHGYYPFGYSGYYDPFSSYNPYYGGFYGGGFNNGFNHGFYPSYGYLNTNTNRGIRRYDLGSYNNGPIRSGKTFNTRTIRSINNNNPNQAPIRSITRPGQTRNAQDGNNMRRVLTPQDRNYDSRMESNRRVAPNRMERSNSNQVTPRRIERSNTRPVRSERRSTPIQRSETRSYENNNRSNQAPVRSNSPSPSYSSPSRSSSPSNSGNSAPVRSVRRGG